MTTKAFSLACVAAILLLVGGVGLFNLVVDPYWYFRAVEIVGFNQIKQHASGNERLVKPALVNRLRPEAIILGNSVAEIGLPPTHRGFTNNGTLSSYNLALPGASWNEIYCLAMFTMRQTGVKRLVIGISEVETGEREEACPPDASFGRADFGKLLFSRSAIAASRETLRQQHLPEVMTREGLWHFHRFDNELNNDEQVAAVIAQQFRDRKCLVVPTQESKFDPARLQKKPVPLHEGASLRALIRLARTKQVELVLVFNPAHVLMSEIHRACEGAESKWDAIWRVVSIVDQEGDPLRTQVWNFGVYVPLNAEPPRNGMPKRDRLWQDMLHFNVPVGGLAFDAIYLGQPGYGERVTVGNFEEIVARRESERAQFLQDNPWIREELDLFARQVAAPPSKLPH
ncbi:MAG TPA: hypothetical protein PLE54_13170 [Burkholderiaceae bacterium]|nr:hypothetical protein [Burkholderiaceae bacterium]HQR71553.1 hypothetical protein [Burkholderiaceae bacterium]